MKDIEWKTVITAVIVVVVLWVLHTSMTTQKVDEKTGVIKTKFSGFDGDEVV